MSENHVELLAPAGNKEAFLGAIHAGADAVYLAGNKYGARAYADNFSKEELLFCIRYAHIWGKKVYMTVNTLFKENELLDLYDYLLPYYEKGLDACIVQDIGVLEFIKENFPQMELHVSTQMTITGVNGAKMLKELGATRIVPARELSLAEIKEIKEETDLELETFIHGAMCYCYSGQCLFSSILGGRSGNRGRCAQPCRLPYKVKTDVTSTKECYPLSLKDMCTLEHIDDLVDAGIDSFKIEGRMKKPEYAAGVTSIYRKYIDKKEKAPNKKIKIDEKDLERLSNLYIRSERHEGYYYKQNGAEMVTLDNPAYNGSDDTLIKEIQEKYIQNKPRMPISIYASFICGEAASVTMIFDNLSVTVYGELVSVAQNKPINQENIEKQLGKLGDTSFKVEILDVYADENAFYSLKALNELRREAVTKLEDLLIEKHGLTVKRSNIISDVNVTSKKLDQSVYTDETFEKDSWTILISNSEQLSVLEKYIQKGKLRFSRIYLESELVLQNKISERLKNQKLYIALPYSLRKKDMHILQNLVAYAKNHSYNGFLIRNIEEYAFLKDICYDGEIYSDASIYIWNSKTLEFWKSRLHGITCPYELNHKEYQGLFQKQVFEKVVYGRIPMMITANCISKTTSHCIHNDDINYGQLTDRYNKQFPVSVNCKYCYNIIYNAVVLSLHKELLKFQNNYIKRLMFTIETKEETLKVLNFFEQIEQGIDVSTPYREYTAAHENRGVE